MPDELTPDQADDPVVVRETADRVKRAVADLIATGLHERNGVFE